MASVTEIGSGVSPSSSTSYQLTLSGSAAVGDLVFVTVEGDTSGSITVANFSDAQGNTWSDSGVDAIENSSGRAVHLFYSVLTHALSGGTDWVKQTTVGSSNKGIVVRKLTGATSISVDKTHSAINQSSGTALAPGSSGTLSQATELAVVCYLYESNPTFTAPGGWSQTTTTQLTVTGGACSASTCYLLTAATTALNPSATLGTAELWGACIATFKYTASSVPVNTVAPAVTGTTTVGQTLSCTTGSWTDDGSPTYSYQWKRDAQGSGSYSSISSATSSTYVLVDADDACHIKCTVTDSTPDGNTVQDSNIVGTVVEPAPTNSVAPTISGSAPQGSTLTCNSNGTWAHMGGTIATYAYQWTRAGTNISGATASTYQTVNADVGSAIGVKVAATNTGGTATGVASSNTVTPTAAGFHTGTLTMQFPIVADIVAEWAVTGRLGSMLLLGVG